MSFQGWTVFALFWVVFVTTPGPNHVNCLQSGMTYGFRRGLWSVLGILTQASLFLTLSALGVTALITASPEAFFWARIVGALVLIWLGLRTLLRAHRPMATLPPSGRSIYLRAFLIATLNAKSLAGYMAAFSQFVQPDVPIGTQMWYIAPTALTITTTIYSCTVALGAGLGRLALGAVLNVWFRRVMGVLFVVYGVLLGGTALSDRPV